MKWRFPRNDFAILFVVISSGALDEPCGKKPLLKSQGREDADDSVEVGAWRLGHAGWQLPSLIHNTVLLVETESVLPLKTCCKQYQNDLRIRKC